LTSSSIYSSPSLISQARDHAQGVDFPQPDGRQGDELLVLNIEVEIGNRVTRGELLKYPSKLR
jgi:hypothetical protein